MEEKLNLLLSDLIVEYHKLQNFHWYAEGRNFFAVHEKLEQYFREINESIDDVAETILMLELKPISNLSDILAKTQIKEVESGYIKGHDIYNIVLADFEYLKQLVTIIKKQADDEMIYQASALMDGLIAQFAKNIWMIKQVQTENVPSYV
ncbi:MAG: DNA starvation/stationary phase protection protein [Rikenellaceae bacterium]